MAHTLSHWKEMRVRSNANRQQPLESAPAPYVQQLLKVEEVADMIGGSLVNVYLLLRSGLPSVSIDGARRFQPNNGQAWIEQHSA